MAIVKELFTPENNGISTRKNGTAGHISEDDYFHGERKAAV